LTVPNRRRAGQPLGFGTPLEEAALESAPLIPLANGPPGSLRDPQRTGIAQQGERNDQENAPFAHRKKIEGPIEIDRHQGEQDPQGNKTPHHPIDRPVTCTIKHEPKPIQHK